MKELISYLDSKERFEHYIKRKIEGRCHVNNKGWAKLTEYHLGNYLKELENPFGFLYNVKTFHKSVYRRTPCMVKFYHKYHKARIRHWDEITYSLKDKDGEITKFTITSNELINE